MDSDYSKRELDRMFSEIQETLHRIETQTTQHNHRMSKVEFWIAFLRGIGAFIAIMLIPLVAAVITLYRK